MSNSKKRVDEFIELSKKIGARPDFVQGGGGNLSVKFDNEHMAVKASGSLLSQMTKTIGYTIVKYQEIAHNLKPELSERAATRLVLENNLELDGYATGKPSMETGFHAVLDRYVIHTHSVYANVLNCMQNGKHFLETNEKLQTLNPIWVPYIAPGLKLSLHLKQLKKDHPEAGLFFLENHGIVTTGKTLEGTQKLHETINEVLCEQLSLPQFTPPPTLSKISDKEYQIPIPETMLEPDYIRSHVLTPDHAIYLDQDFVIKENVLSFLCNEKKAFNMLQTLWAGLYIMSRLKQINQQPQFISDEDVAYFQGLPSETFRKNQMK